MHIKGRVKLRDFKLSASRISQTSRIVVDFSRTELIRDGLTQRLVSFSLTSPHFKLNLLTDVSFRPATNLKFKLSVKKNKSFCDDMEVC